MSLQKAAPLQQHANSVHARSTITMPLLCVRVCVSVQVRVCVRALSTRYANIYYRVTLKC